MHSDEQNLCPGNGYVVISCFVSNLWCDEHYSQSRLSKREGVWVVRSWKELLANVPASSAWVCGSVLIFVRLEVDSTVQVATSKIPRGQRMCITCCKTCTSYKVKVWLGWFCAMLAFDLGRLTSGFASVSITCLELDSGLLTRSSQTKNERPGGQSASLLHPCTSLYMLSSSCSSYCSLPALLRVSSDPSLCSLEVLHSCPLQ